MVTENPCTKQLNLQKHGIIKIKNNKNVLDYLQTDYVFLEYEYVIRGCTLSTFHRDVTSSKYIFNADFPTYTFIKYYNQGPHISFCPGSHKTTPFLFASPLTLFGNSGDGYLFDCDLVHSGALNNYGDSRHAVQYKLVHKSDLYKFSHLQNIRASTTNSCNINQSYELFQRYFSLLFAFPVNHIFTPLLQNKPSNTISNFVVSLTGKQFYNSI